MDKEKIKLLITQLREELDALPQDEETTQLLKNFDSDLSVFLSASDHDDASTLTSETTEPLTETAKRLEAHFAAKHPVVESSLREIIDILVRMGL